MRNIFLSFLGTNRYKPANYTFGGQKIQNVRFVQEAMVKLFCSDFGPGDRIFLFLTDAARSANWNPPEGLKNRLEDLDLKASVFPVAIADGNSEKEIWQIFSKVYDVFEKGDRVILDITHGFRSLPMLAMVLLNYVRFLKEITIQGVYYGAFETLGPGFEVEKMRIEDRNAPIFDLTSFDHLLQWSQGAENFVNYGNPKKMIELINAEASPVLKETRGKDKEACHIRYITKLLDDLNGQLSTNRGLELVSGNIAVKLKERIDELDTQRLPALKPLLEPIKKKIDAFKTDHPDNCVVAARWCLYHDLIQQGITILQEGIVTIVLERAGEKYQDELRRTVVSDCFKVCSQGISPENWSEVLNKNVTLARKLLKISLLCQLAPIYERLREFRNDINHGGFTVNRGAGAFRKALQDSLANVESVLSTRVE